jgi:cell division protein FtsL
VIRLNLVLLLAVLVSAFYLVHVQYDSRRLYTALDRMRAQAQRLEADHEQLVVQKRAQATPARVQQIAIKQLQMRPANPAITEYVKPAPVALPSATAASTEGAKP